MFPNSLQQAMSTFSHQKWVEAIMNTKINMPCWYCWDSQLWKNTSRENRSL